MSGNERIIRIGTRGSPLAMAQTKLVCEALGKAHPALQTEIKVIKTSGDWKPEHGETPLSAVEGGKGLFAKEIQMQLLAGEIDAAVHSMKDMDSHLPEGLAIKNMLPREDVRDALLLYNQSMIADYSQLKNAPFSVLSDGAVVGAASVRRTAMLKHVRPDVNIVPIRGNVQTRIDKLRGPNALSGMDATFLAMAGLNRLGLSDEADIILEPEIMLPAAGQGAVGIETRTDDHEVSDVFESISDRDTVLCVGAERAALKELDGSCHTPIGAYAQLNGAKMYLRLCVVALDGSEVFKDEATGSVETLEQAETLGRDLAAVLKNSVPAGIL
jgi:hydroxymethylbilane synthase